MVATSADARASVVWPPPSRSPLLLNATRATPRGLKGPQAGCRTRIDLAPRHPARLTTESTAGLLARGSLPVTAFPGLSQWLCGSGSPLTVAGAAAAWELAFRTAFPVRSRYERPSIGSLKEPTAALSMRRPCEVPVAAKHPRISHSCLIGGR